MDVEWTFLAAITLPKAWICGAVPTRSRAANPWWHQHPNATKDVIGINNDQQTKNGGRMKNLIEFGAIAEEFEMEGLRINIWIRIWALSLPSLRINSGQDCDAGIGCLRLFRQDFGPTLTRDHLQ